MSARIRRFTVATSLVVLGLAGAGVLAQNVLAQLGQTEASARDHILTEFGDNGTSESRLIVPAYQAYDTLSPAARGQVTTGLYAWTKTYVNSAAFKKAYADKRAFETPQPHLHKGTVDEELKAALDARNAEFEKTARDLIAAGMKEYVDNMRKTMNSPAAVSAAREDIERTRAKDKADYDLLMKEWQRNLPPDPMTAIARHLTEFLAATSDVDFAAKATKVIDVGAFYHYEFANPAYNQKPWQWRWSYSFGPEALSAARTAAATWLKELGAK